MTLRRRKNTHTSSLQKSIHPLYIVIAILFLLFAFSLFLNLKFIHYGQGGLSFYESLKNRVFPQRTPFSCTYHDTPDPEGYMPRYVVQKGDSLLSIAKNMLNDASRVNELVELNKRRYPSLSLKSPFIEVGWSLTIPPEYFPPSSGGIAIVRGLLTEMKIPSNTWYIQHNTSYAGPEIVDVQVDKAISDKKPISEYKIGDCVTVVWDYKSNFSIIFVDPQ